MIMSEALGKDTISFKHAKCRQYSQNIAKTKTPLIYYILVYFIRYYLTSG